MHLMTSSTPEQHEMARLKREEEEETRSNGKLQQKAATDAVVSSNNNNGGVIKAKPRVQYGAPTPVEASGTFPQAGSILGPYFCLGTLGKGTFSSIHKCINLDYAHVHSNSTHTPNKGKNCRVAAAKVELSTFVNSGVLLGEALVLNFLDESLPRGTVPVYMGHYTCQKGDQDAAAIVMEYLPGEDMHQLRDNRNAQAPTNTNTATGVAKAPRRLTIEDAVYLTADVMLPLLEQMHKVGIVHRDVKPSNCVRKKGKEFCMVDFGLSKSIVVPLDSGFADPDHKWPAGQPWLSPENSATASNNINNTNSNSSSRTNSPQLTHTVTPTTQQGCFRKERTTADFRGTSMYASPRVHQGRDYSPRDDIWSLLYVFCDLVSGGLPWMSHAANRDREMCQLIKERVHGLTTGGGTQDETERLLMGDEYHVATFRHLQKEGGESTKNPAKPDPATLPENFPKALEMSQDKTKIKLLRQAFAHLAKLQFWDKPDYGLIRRCIHGFLDEEGAVGEVDDVEIDWSQGPDLTLSEKKKRKRDEEERDVPRWEFRGTLCDPEMDEDPMVEDGELFEGIEVPPVVAEQNYMTDYEKSIRRLPLERQFRIAQMEYHASNPTTALKHIVLRDWMKVAIPLLYKEWDSKANEIGGHRTSTDGYRREFYLELVEKCSAWAKLFGNFGGKEYFGHHAAATNGVKLEDGVKVEDGEVPPQKKRNIHCTFPAKIPNELAAVSKVVFGLQVASRNERDKKFAPPPPLSFGATR